MTKRTAIAAGVVSTFAAVFNLLSVPFVEQKKNRLNCISSSASVSSPSVSSLAPHFRMEAQSRHHDPMSQTEFMVDMKCNKCVDTVKSTINAIEGVKNVEVDLDNQVVRVLGATSVQMVTQVLQDAGLNARVIGQGAALEFSAPAAVAEFKGPTIFGVVRVTQVGTGLTTIEASFSGLSCGKHGWAINEFGDLTSGVTSTGKIFNPGNQQAVDEPVGDLGTLDVDEKGNAYVILQKRLNVTDLIGRSIVIHETESKSVGIMAAVIARSASVGENYKRVCTCDGTTIWDANVRQFPASKF